MAGICQQSLVLLGLQMPNSSLRFHLHLGSPCLCQAAFSSAHKCVSVHISLFFQGHKLYQISAHLYTLLLTQSHLQRPYFHVRSYAQVLGVRTSIYLFGDTAQPITERALEKNYELGSHLEIHSKIQNVHTH